MASIETVHVKMFGALRQLRRDQGLPIEVTLPVPPEGTTAQKIARDLGLPDDRIEGAFCNHTIRPLSHHVMPGDEVAFVPPGTPGPHRFFLGLYEAGKQR